MNELQKFGFNAFFSNFISRKYVDVDETCFISELSDQRLDEDWPGLLNWDNELNSLNHQGVLFNWEVN